MNVNVTNITPRNPSFTRHSPVTLVNNNANAGQELRMDYLKQYALYMQMDGKRPGTITSRLAALRRAETVMGVPLHQATRDDLIGWRATLLGKSDAYVLAQASHIRCCTAWLHAEGHRPDNPATRIPVPRKPHYLPRPIGEDELADALASAPARIRLWLVLAAWCGLRACEIAGLRRRNVCERARPQPYLRVAADATKGVRARVVPLCEFAAAEITAARLPLGEWASPRLDGQPGPVAPHRVSMLCNDFLHELGYPDTLHSLRHRFATEALRASGNVRVVQELLGHARPDSTAGYTLVVLDQAAEAVAQIPAPRRLSSVAADLPLSGRPAHKLARARTQRLRGAAL